MKKIIILLSILLSIIIIVLVTISSSLYFNASENKGNGSSELDKTLKQVDNIGEFYAVKDCVEEYYLYCATIFDTEYYMNNAFEAASYSKEDIETYRKHNQNALYNIIDEEIKKEKQITIDNIDSKINEVKTGIVNVTNIYVSQQSENINVYIARGMLKEEVTQKITDFQIMVKMDTTNKTFSIIPQEYVQEKYNNLEIGKELEIKVQEKINVNDNNTYELDTISEEKYIKNLFGKLKNEIHNFPELVYNRLDTEYRNKKYVTFQEFQDFLNKNKDKHLAMVLTGYKKTITDKYTQYICVDQNNNYYIFREKGIMDYSLILDIYTVDISEINESYDSSEINKKIALNIGKVIEATKNEDYKYVYNKLNESFRKTNYKTLEEFEKFIKEKYNPNEDRIDYEKYEEINGVHVLKIVVIDTSERKTINAKVVMNLKEGRDFEFSFSAE